MINGIDGLVNIGSGLNNNCHVFWVHYLPCVESNYNKIQMTYTTNMENIGLVFMIHQIFTLIQIYNNNNQAS
jgi:hypothetical protein